MVTIRKLRTTLKSKYNLAVGELTLEKARCKINKIIKTKIRVSGRSYKTGKKKTISLSVVDLLR